MNPNVNYKKFLKDNIDYLSLENGCVVAAFYKFFQIDDILEFQKILKLILKESGVNGTILVAHEGINGTITGKVFEPLNPHQNRILGHVTQKPPCGRGCSKGP